VNDDILIIITSIIKYHYKHHQVSLQASSNHFNHKGQEPLTIERMKEEKIKEENNKDNYNNVTFY